MQEWWQSLNNGAPVYWAIAICASVLQVLLIFGSLVGLGFDSGHGDGGADATGHADGGSGLKLLSFRILVAFFLGFGWAGVLGLQKGMSALSAAMTALAVGGAFMLTLFFMLRFLLAMRSDGTLNFNNAVGQAGRVYVTVPAARQGPGQVELKLQGRLITASAVTNWTSPLPPRLPIRVTAVEPGNLLVVEPNPEPAPDHA